VSSGTVQRGSAAWWLGVWTCLGSAGLLIVAFASTVQADPQPGLKNHAFMPLIAADSGGSTASPVALTVRFQAVQVSDDDGKRAGAVTTDQVKQWVDKANAIYAAADVRFLYDPASDFATLKSTLLNDMSGDTDTNWKSEVDAGNRAAAGYPGRLVVFFRHGPGKQATGGGFSSEDYNFVVMPGFGTSVCGYQNIGALAHELGHYLGLSHPFARIFSSLQDAQSYFTAHGDDPTVFDGDGLSDTPPDPFIDAPAYQCGAVASITLDGRNFPLPRTNIMSYYGSTAGVDRTDVTVQQTDIVRWLLVLRANHGMATPTNVDVADAIDFTSLPIKDRNGVDASVQDMSAFGDYSRWLGDRQLFCSAQANGLIDFSVSVAAKGKYALNLYATMAPNFGRVQTLVDGIPLGEPIDLHGLLVLPTGKLPVGTLELSVGTHTVGFRVVGKADASNGYAFGLNELTLDSGAVNVSLRALVWREEGFLWPS
jgi:hypothetical protein